MRYLLSILFLLSFLRSTAQELPPIEKFSASVYDGANQNWMISQDNQNYIYVANNKGLLEYNGAEWTTYLSPNNSILRSVNVIDNRIYTGCYEEFGYWERDQLGTLNYTSLVSKLKEQSISDDQIWNIVDYKEWVIFQSGHILYFYNKESEAFKTLVSENNIIYKVFNVNNRIYYHVANEGVYLIEDGEPRLLIEDDLVIEDRVINIFENEDILTILTRKSGFYQYVNNELITWEIEANKRLKTLNIFNSIRLKDNSFVVGTIANGVVKINNTGSIEYNISQKLGLSNNTVLSLFEDRNNNVWVGSDNGINCINLESPIKAFVDYEGVLGTVYTTIVFKDLLYVGTNQGLFYRSLEKVNEEFQFVLGTAGQVWSLYNDNNQNLLCGHHLGTFLINKNEAKNISPILGTWNFKKVPNQDNLLLQGNYDGLYVLERQNNLWKIRNKIEGFKNSSRFFEINDANEILVNHEYKGVYNLKLNSTLSKVEEVNLNTEFPIGNSSSLIAYRNNILYTSKDGIYAYNKDEGKFVKDTELSSMVVSKKYTSGKMVVDETDKLWSFSQDNISFITNDNLTNKPEITNIPMPSKLRKGVLGFENIKHINNEKYIMGTANGYLLMDVSKTNLTTDYIIYLNTVNKKYLDEESITLSIEDEGEFEHKQSVLSFHYSVPQYNKFLDVNYQYRLKGLTDNWSNWSQNSSIQFENLSFGNYKLEVRAKIGNQLTVNTANYVFVVNRPWYISNLALIVYLILLCVIGFLIHKAYKSYYKRILKHEQIKSERAIIQIKNENLSQDIESKNRELAISTMSIIKKNELLGKIKKELKSSKNNEDLSSAISLIDNNLNNNKDWNFFKRAFNNADKDFMDKIKSAHPELTPNDLKFCAYLRLNLSSKEMAPLLNISIKSVETKRYRLRKRLNLDHDESLVNYILKF